MNCKTLTSFKEFNDKARFSLFYQSLCKFRGYNFTKDAVRGSIFIYGNWNANQQWYYVKKYQGKIGYTKQEIQEADKLYELEWREVENEKQILHAMGDM